MMIEQVFMVPDLHRDEQLEALCPDLRWLCPCLTGASDSGFWPLSSSEVAAYLREVKQWAESGLTGTEARSCHRLAHTEQRMRHESRSAQKLHWNSEHQFTVPTEPEPELLPDPDLLKEAQRFLLAAWTQEENVLEIRRLAVRYAQEAKRLHNALSDDASGPIPDSDPNTVPGALLSNDPIALADNSDSDLLPAWRPVIERLALFLPRTATLCTRDTRIIESLHETGLCRARLHDKGLRCPDALQPMRERLFGEHLPMWRLLGYTQTQAGRPWLDIERPFVIIMPDGTGNHV